LKKGGSDHPLKVLKEAGVDMESTEPIENAIEKYKEYIDRMEKEL